MLPVHSHDVDGDLSDCNVEKCLTVQNSDSDLQLPSVCFCISCWTQYFYRLLYRMCSKSFEHVQIT